MAGYGQKVNVSDYFQIWNVHSIFHSETNNWPVYMS